MSNLADPKPPWLLLLGSQSVCLDRNLQKIILSVSVIIKGSLKTLTLNLALKTLFLSNGYPWKSMGICPPFCMGLRTESPSIVGIWAKLPVMDYVIQRHNPLENCLLRTFKAMGGQIPYAWNPVWVLLSCVVRKDMRRPNIYYLFFTFEMPWK